MKLLALALIAIIASVTVQAEPKTIAERVAEFRDAVGVRLAPPFKAAGVTYPPAKIALIGIKKDRVLELHAAGEDGVFKFIRAYPVLAASGELGPKLNEGDRQVPEGIYRVRELNPNSLYHLSLWLDYPNDFDQARATEEARTKPGSEIMIHGSDQSRGCLAMGDEAAEDLFVLAASVGIENVRVLLTPVDFRTETFNPPAGTPPWTDRLYEEIALTLATFTSPASR
ncbi:MAG: murein L,D-transpeptidase family protein [Chthoniobacterales bacterium]